MAVELTTQQCPECFSVIDARAKTCPNCRKKLVTSGTWHLGSFIMALGLVIAIFGLCIEPISAVVIGGVVLGIGYVIRKGDG